MNDIIKLEIENFKKCKTPLKTRLKKSLFANLISNFTDQEVKALAYCLLINPDVKKAIDYYSKTVNNEIQLIALRSEFEKRKIMIKKITV